MTTSVTSAGNSLSHERAPCCPNLEHPLDPELRSSRFRPGPPPGPARASQERSRRMRVLRTPDERFEDLRDFPFEPRYVEIDDGEGGRLRTHYVEEGRHAGEPVLSLHAEPTWSALYHTLLSFL